MESVDIDLERVYWSRSVDCTTVDKIAKELVEGGKISKIARNYGTTYDIVCRISRKIREGYVISGCDDPLYQDPLNFYSNSEKICKYCGKPYTKTLFTNFCSEECSFWSRVKKGNNPEDCWTWTGIFIKDKKNRRRPYPAFPTNNEEGNRTMILAHRYMYKLVKGIMPNDELVRTCGNLDCINPDHLRVGKEPFSRSDKHKRYIDSIPDELLEAIEEIKVKLKDIKDKYDIQPNILKRAWSHLHKEINMDLMACPQVCGCYHDTKTDFPTYCHIMKLLRAGVSQVEVSKQIGVSESLVSRILSGER